MALPVALRRLRVGLYNSIPDIGDDHFQSYVNFITRKWDDLNTGVGLTVCCGKKYEPYGDLGKFLGTGPDSFDLIETDMARASELVGRVAEISKGTNKGEIDPNRYLKPCIDAVFDQNTEKYIGYPTLACGNFIIEIKHKSEEVTDLNGTDYDSFKEDLQEAEKEMVWDGKGKKPTSKHLRLIGGKIDDSSGWYLPFIYLDGAIDVEGPNQMQKIISDVLHNKPNAEVVERLKNFFAYFKDSSGKLDEKDITKDVADSQDAYFFGFSEKLSLILKDANYEDIKATNVLSPPFGKTNYVIVYTDALVINKQKYDGADETMKDAIEKFAKFFTSDEIRTDFVMGKDMEKEKIRYLLLPIKEFYEETTNPIYKAYFEILKRGINAPPISETDRQKMEDILKPLVGI